MYFPLIVKEALMIEPTETESKETIDAAIDIYLELVDIARKNPEILLAAPEKTAIGRPDETRAARSPVLKYEFES
jgi:glycine dehydrogenase subunit 2